jgi:molecular chaperone HscB
MTPDSIPVAHVPSIECRSCGAGAPVDDHFCPSCSRILGLGRHGDYFVFMGFPRKLDLDQAELERRFRELSRQFHPDYYYNATPAERRASLERSSYLNDAFRTLRSPVGRLEHLLAIEGLPPAKTSEGAAKVPPGLLEAVFALNEELDEVRELRESGADPEEIRRRLAAARQPIDERHRRHETELRELGIRWDTEHGTASPENRRAILEALRERLLERNYINNLMSSIERELGMADDVGSPEPRGARPEARAPRPQARAPRPEHG